MTTRKLLINQRENKQDYQKTLDFFPTPKYATRMLFEYGDLDINQYSTVLEPCAGMYHMSSTIEEFITNITAKDIIHGDDFLNNSCDKKYDWVITNPPYKYATEFVNKSLKLTNKGVCMFLRYTFNEGQRRYEALFKDNPPSKILNFSKRIGLKHGETDSNAGSAVLYQWFIWEHGWDENYSKLYYLPPINDEFKKDGDDDYTWNSREERKKIYKLISKFLGHDYYRQPIKCESEVNRILEFLLKHEFNKKVKI